MGTATDWTSIDSVARLAQEQERTYGAHSLELADTLTKLGDLYFVAEDFNNAEDCYWRALSIRQKTLGQAHKDTAATLINLAELYEIQDRYAESQRFYQWATEVKKQAMLKERSDRLETTQTMQRPIVLDRLPKVAELKGARCRVCNRQLLDSAVCLYCTQSAGFDAMAILREAGLSITDPGARRGPVNVLEVQDSRQRYRLREHEIKIGRHPSNAIVFADDRNVSRYHATLAFKAGNYYITDNNTVNGTYVNGERLTGERKLERGDVLVIGNVVLLADFTSEG